MKKICQYCGKSFSLPRIYPEDGNYICLKCWREGVTLIPSEFEVSDTFSTS